MKKLLYTVQPGTVATVLYIIIGLLNEVQLENPIWSTQTNHDLHNDLTQLI